MDFWRWRERHPFGAGALWALGWFGAGVVIVLASLWALFAYAQEPRAPRVVFDLHWYVAVNVPDPLIERLCAQAAQTLSAAIHIRFTPDGAVIQCLVPPIGRVKPREVPPSGRVKPREAPPSAPLEN